MTITQPAATPVRPGDTVLRTGHDGAWIVHDWEDDETVWVYRLGTRMVMTVVRSVPGLVTLGNPWRLEPAHAELAALAHLTPAPTEKSGQ